MKKLLDVGCGPGTIGNIGLYHELERNYQIYGIDPDKKNISLIQKRYPQGIFKIGRAEKIPYDNNFFDAVVIRHVLEHVENPGKTMAEINRISKHGASVNLAVPHPNLENLISRITPDYVGKGHHHQRIFSRKSLISLLTRNGYIISDVRNDKWPLFIIVTVMSLIAAVTGKIRMEEQSGIFLVNQGNYLNHKNNYILYLYIYKLLNLLNSILFFLNYFIPFEISARVRKK